jgi:AraC-like DNA-binding protein
MTTSKQLHSFHLVEHLKQHFSPNFSAPFFLATHDTFDRAAIGFPLRNFFYGIGLVYSGSCHCTIGSTAYQLGKNSLITIGPGIISQWSQGFDATSNTVFFTEALFDNTLKNSFLGTLGFFLPGGNHVIALSDPQAEKIKLLFQTLTEVQQEPEAVAGLVYSLLMLVTKAHDQASHQHANASVGEKIAREFYALLARQFLHHRDVGYYAQQMHVTPKYLSEVLLVQTGKPTKRIIDDYVFLEAKSLLRQTSMTVSEICDWLGYKDTSYFTKAFKMREGITPLEYRRQ